MKLESRCYHTLDGDSQSAAPSPQHRVSVASPDHSTYWDMLDVALALATRRERIRERARQDREVMDAGAGWDGSVVDSSVGEGPQHPWSNI